MNAEYQQTEAIARGFIPPRKAKQQIITRNGRPPLVFDGWHLQNYPAFASLHRSTSGRYALQIRMPGDDWQTFVIDAPDDPNAVAAGFQVIFDKLKYGEHMQLKQLFTEAAVIDPTLYATLDYLKSITAPDTI